MREMANRREVRDRESARERMRTRSRQRVRSFAVTPGRSRAEIYVVWVGVGGLTVKSGHDRL